MAHIERASAAFADAHVDQATLKSGRRTALSKVRNEVDLESDDFHHVGFERDTKPAAQDAEDDGKIFHTGITFTGEHLAKAPAGSVRLVREALEPDRRIDEVTQDQSRDMRLVIEKSGCSFEE